MVVEMDEATRAQVAHLFTGLEADVTMHVFVESRDCLYCNDTLALAKLVAGISDKVHVQEHRGALGTGIAAELGVKYAPAIVLHGEKRYKVRFYGIPVGHEFGALIGTIVDVSTGTPPLPPDVVSDIAAIESPIHTLVFTTPQCPYCPNMVRLSHQSAIINPLIESDMIESLEFQHLTMHYGVFGVPKTVINDQVEIEGLVPPEVFVEKLYQAVER
ncbi:MAG: thioredoxin family protein [Candidatus Thorarchaeota archaeon]